MVKILWCTTASEPSRRFPIFVLILVAACANGVLSAQSNYYGKYIGKLKSLHHGVTGEVYAVDARTLHIRDFNYDGEGPAAYFYAGDSKSPNGFGFRINDEKGTPNVLSRYRRKHITLTLPDNKTLRDIKWFSVWCDEFSVNFGDVRIPKNLDYPKPQKIDGLKGVHAVSSEEIVVVDAQTLLIPSFSYDGEAPDAKFWVGAGSKPSPQGARVPDENGKEDPLRRYDRKTIVLTLPKDMTVFDVGHFGVWCEAFTVDFGHVRIPRSLNVPPSLKMLGVSPQSKLNCEILFDEKALEVRWAVAGDSVVIQLVGKIDDGDYMAFGLSGDNSSSVMIGSDVAVAWVNHSTLAGEVQDYFLADKSQCSGKTGSCPDINLGGIDNIRRLNSAMVNGYSIVTYQRPLHAGDKFDLPIWTSGSQPVVWAIGPLNSLLEVSYHHTVIRHDVFIEFSRAPKWNCPIPEVDGAYGETSPPSTTPSRSRTARPTQITETVTTAPQRQTAVQSRRTSRPRATPAPAPQTNAWDIPAIQCHEPDDGVFYAQMGPTGGKHGYSTITGHVGWGISWYINGLLIPEINVVRGRSYNFVVEGGLDPETPARYHPFYITDDPIGGYEHKTPEERAKIRVFAGVKQNRHGEVYPTGTGRLCTWTPNPDQPPADEFASFGAYQRTLTLECDEGVAGLVVWTPDDNTPDTVYYQCYTHRYLGWKINVLDSCDTSAAASEPVSIRLPGGQDSLEQGDDDDDDEEGELQSRPSIRVATRVKPNGVFYSGDKGISEEMKESVFQGFEQLPSNTQEHFQQEFPFSLVETSDTNQNENSDVFIQSFDTQQNTAQYSQPATQYIPLENIEIEPKPNVFASPLVYQKEQDTYLIPENYGGKLVQEINDSADNDSPFKPSVPLNSQHDITLSAFSQPETSQQIQPDSQQITEPQALTFEQEQNTAIPITIPSQTEINQHQQKTIQFDSSLSAADPTRKPVIHATTPHSVLSVNTELQDVKLVSSTPQPVQTIDTENHQTVKQESEIKPQEITRPHNTTESDVVNSNSENTATVINAPVMSYKRPYSHRPHGLAPHGYVMPSTRPGVYSAHPQMMYIRPQGYSFRRPVPHRGYAHMHRPVTPTVYRYAMSTPVPPNYIMTSKKPVYRVTIMGPPHRTMVSPPPFIRPMSTITMHASPSRTATTIIPIQQQYPSTFKNVQYALPPQRIKYDKIQTRLTSTTTTLLPEMKFGDKKKFELLVKPTIVSPASLISTSEDPSKLNMPIAVNTGFHPESVVVEGGFKPIVHKTIVAQDRSSQSESEQEETAADLKVIEKVEKEIVEELNKETKEKDERKDNPFEGQQPETFEPMFIPSPPDRIVAQYNITRNKITNKKAGSISEELIPPVPSLNHRNSVQASRNPPQAYGLVRPRPGVIRRPVYSNKVSPPFVVPVRSSSPSFRYHQVPEESQDETPMAAERMDTYYLPPTDYNIDTSSNERVPIPLNVGGQIPPGAVVTYDGKSVLDVSLASSISDPSASTISTFHDTRGTADLIRGTPQFGPFRGEVPPPVPNVVRPESIPQLQNQNKQQAQTLPLQFSQQSPYSSRPSTQTTRLSVVQNYNDGDDLVSAGSEVKELVLSVKGSKVKSTKDKQKAYNENYKRDSTEEVEDVDTTNGQTLWPTTTILSIIDDILKITTSSKEEGTQLSQRKGSEVAKLRHISVPIFEINRQRVQREKRSASPHHEPGHVGTDDHSNNENHDHSQHNHDHHDMHAQADGNMPQKEQQGSNVSNALSTFTLLNVILLSLLATRFV